MERFYKALTSGKKNEVLPEEFVFLWEADRQLEH